MKKLKRLAAVLLALTMVCGMSLTAFAEDPAPTTKTQSATGTANDKGTITINGLGKTDAAGDAKLTIAAYPIITAKYEGSNGLFSGYTEVYKDKLAEGTTYLNVDSITPGGNLTIPNTEYLNAVKAYIDNNSVTPVKSEEISESQATYTFTDMAVGTYMILITGAEENIYSPLVASIYYAAHSTGEDGSTTENGFVNGEVDLVSTDNLWVKKSDNPTINKTIDNSNGTDHSNSVSVGDKVPYVVSVKPIPYYGGEHPVFNIVDTMDQGLTYNEDMVIVIRDESGAVIADPAFTAPEPVVSTEGGKTTITVDFAPNKNYMLNQWQGKELYITYSATLNDKATMDQIANVNNVKLNYTHDSKVNSDDVKDFEEDETYTYTFDIDGGVTGSVTNKIITKIGEEKTEDHGFALQGAKFKLYTDADCTKEYENKVFKNPITSDDNGQLKISGLKADASNGTTYYLKETEAPEGYSLNTNVYAIKITPVYDAAGDKRIKQFTIIVSTGDTTLSTNVFDVTYEKDANGKVTNTQVTLNKTEENGGLVFDQGTITNEQSSAVNGTEIKNTKLTSLPSTGGIGTTIFTIGGCLIMIIAAGLFFATRKKSAK